MKLQAEILIWHFEHRFLGHRTGVKIDDKCIYTFIKQLTKHSSTKWLLTIYNVFLILISSALPKRNGLIGSMLMQPKLTLPCQHLAVFLLGIPYYFHYINLFWIFVSLRQNPYFTCIKKKRLFQSLEVEQFLIVPPKRYFFLLIICDVLFDFYYLTCRFYFFVGSAWLYNYVSLVIWGFPHAELQSESVSISSV